MQKTIGWNDTVKAARRVKEEERIQKLEEKEMSRREVDAMEEALRVSERQT